ncbi:unnamed protein product [Rhizophagus irregularis]|uniref:Uncharacterized protein n=1 Tax=Rhizophagus irregularis TaxID=588596 RepID=A0A915ZFU5_9GLOM|nr:unnamed protein product [Rhizophagus irregularis]
MCTPVYSLKSFRNNNDNDWTDLDGILTLSIFFKFHHLENQSALKPLQTEGEARDSGLESVFCLGRIRDMRRFCKSPFFRVDKIK